MRRLEASARSFSVELAPRAWMQIGGLSSEEFRRVRLRLEQLAVEAVSGTHAAPAGSALSFQDGDLLCTYEISDERRAVHLLQIARSLPNESGVPQ